MEDQRFDSLTKGLARGRTRRELLKIFAGGAAGSVLAMGALGEASAQCAGDGALCGGMYADCCAGFVCSNSYCAAEAPAQEPQPVTTTDTSTSETPATVLPATGSGPASTDMTPWLGVALAGGAAAWLAGRELRKDAPAAEK